MATRYVVYPHFIRSRPWLIVVTVDFSLVRQKGRPSHQMVVAIMIYQIIILPPSSVSRQFIDIARTHFNDKKYSRLVLKCRTVPLMNRDSMPYRNATVGCSTSTCNKFGEISRPRQYFSAKPNRVIQPFCHRGTKITNTYITSSSV